MHAVVAGVTITERANPEEVTRYLREEVVPTVSQAPGFVAGYWVRLGGGNQGRAVIVFESEEAAREVSEQIQPAPGVELNTAEVGEVVAHA
jgi:hypothetical protein